MTESFSCYNPPVMTKRKAKSEAKHRARAEGDEPGFDAGTDELRREIAETTKNIKLLLKAGKETDKKLKEVGEQIRENGRQIGYIGNREGKLLEERVVDAVWDAKEIGGIPIVDVLPNLKRGNPPCQYDLVCLNGKKTIVAEVKRTLRSDDVVHFARVQVPLFRRAFPEYARGKGVVGAMIYESADGKSAEEALEAGVMLLRAESKNSLRHIQSAADLASKPARAKKRKAK